MIVVIALFISRKKYGSYLKNLYSNVTFFIINHCPVYDTNFGKL